jgi:aspartate kinase
VEGVFTADPRIVPEARRLDRITVEEMLELASLGAKVLQTRSVEFAGKYRIPLRVLSSFTEGPGTLISYEEELMEQPLISAIASNRDEAKLTICGVPDEPGIAYRILGPVSDAHINVDMIIQNVSADNLTDVTFTVHRDDYAQSEKILRDVAAKVGARGVVGADNIAKISVVGVGMRSHAGIATTMFKTLAADSINIQLISTSEIKISVVIEDKYLELAVRALHSAFGLQSADAKQSSESLTARKPDVVDGGN